MDKLRKTSSFRGCDDFSVVMIFKCGGGGRGNLHGTSSDSTLKGHNCWLFRSVKGLQVQKNIPQFMCQHHLTSIICQKTVFYINKIYQFTSFQTGLFVILQTLVALVSWEDIK